jgi:phage/plasmid-associated DNA primase
MTRAEDIRVAHFCSEWVGDHLTTQKTSMYMRYQNWAMDHGEFVMTSTEFPERMCMRFVEGKSGSKGRHWKGIGLRHTFEADLAEDGCTVNNIKNAVQ